MATLTQPASATDWRTPLEILVLGAIWGGSFLFMRIAAPHFGPLPLVAVRVTLGALLLSPFLWRARRQLTAVHWRRFALIGLLNSAIPFSLFAWGAERAPAGIGAIANSMTVLFTALIAFVFYGEHIGKRRGFALVTGFVGVVVLASGRTAGDNIALAAIAGTLASLCYGIAVNLTKRKLIELPAVVGVAGTLSCSALMLALPAVATWPAEAIPSSSWFSAIALGAVCTGFAYFLFFRLIQRVSATRAATCNYLIPVFGVIWGWWLLGETPTPTMLVSGALILGSVIFSQRESARPA
jgi:drug/metabolite transporter (DMT)-like permease